VSTGAEAQRASRWSARAEPIRRRLPDWGAVEWLSLFLTVYLSAPAYSLTPATGLDPSWTAGLALARRDGIDPGPDLMFTYGPWGWLNHPLALNRLDLLVATGFGALAAALAWVAVRRALLRGLSRRWATILAAAVVLLMVPVNAASIAVFVGVATLVLLHVAERRPFGLAAAVGFPAAAAFLLQLKFSEGTVLTAVVAVACVVCARPWPRALVAVASWLATTLVAWLVVGGSAADLPRWVRLSFDVARHYSDAMSLEEEPNTFAYVLAALTVVATLTLTVAAHRTLPRLSLVVLVLVALGVLFLGFREETTRHNYGRMSVLEFCVPVCVLAVHRWRGRTAALVVLALVVLAGNNHRVLLDPDRARLQTASTLEVLVDTGYQEELLETARQTGRDQYALPPELVDSLRGHPVSVDGYEVVLPWYYGLRWSPRPVLQSYSAYSDALADLEVDWLAARPDGHRILRPVTTGIDGRNSLWDPPGYVLAELCRTRALTSTDAWLLLATQDDRCSAPSRVLRRSLDRGEVLELPAATADQIVTVSFEEDSPGPLVLLGRLVDKSFHPLMAEVDGVQSFRLPRDLADGPLVTRVPESLGWPAQFGGATDYRTISFSEPGSVTVNVVDLG